MSETATESFISRPISIQPSDWAKIEKMAAEKRLNPSSLIRMLVMPLIEAWERENSANCQEAD